MSARLKELFNYNSNGEDLHVLCRLNIFGKSKFKVSFLSRIDSNISRFKFYRLSDFVIPFFRVKCSSYSTVLPYLLSPIFRHINCLADLIPKINAMSDGFISELLFRRFSIKRLFSRRYSKMLPF